MARPLHCNGKRPKLPPELRPVSQTVRLSPQTADVVCRMAIRRGVSVYSFLGGIIERVIEKHKIAHPIQSCYGEPNQSSTLGTVLSESTSKGRTGPSAASEG
jgi:hypothetical protein